MSHLDPTEERRAQQLLAELTQRPVALSSSLERETLRARLLPALRRQVRDVPLRRAERRARKLRTTWGLAAAAILIAGVGVSTWRPTQEPPLLVLQPRGNAVEWVDHGRHRSLVTSESIRASGRLETQRSAALTTAEGVFVELSEATQVGLDELNENSGWRLRLHRGHVECDVPKLGEKKSFSVVTPDAEVVVHGTRFTVTSGAESTCVRVSEGRVEVRSKGTQTFVSPGEQWGCDTSSENAPPSAAAGTVSALETAPSDRRAERRLTPRTSTPKPVADNALNTTAPTPNAALPSNASGTLALESELVARALSAERRGDAKSARALYARFLERYPASPMAPEARRGLERVAHAH